MKKASLILRYELLTTLRRKSFLLVTLGVPILVAALLAGMSLADGDTGGSSGQTATQGSGWSSVEGYVDQSGLIRQIPSVVPRDHLVAFADEAGAREALASGRIAAYYLIPADYVARGELFYVYPDSRPLTADGEEWQMTATLLVNLLGGDEELAERVLNPVDLEVFDLGAGLQQGQRSQNLWARTFPSLMAALLFGTFMIGSTILSESVAAEKENRTIEVLMLSASPQQIFAGKIAGLGAAAVIQAFSWLAAIYFLMELGGRGLGLPSDSPFPPSLLVWGLLFFLLGYAQYATLMAGAGALVSHLKEVSQVSYLVLSPLMAGYVVAILAPLADRTQATLPVALSLFPPTAPVVMVMRLAAGPVPLWQLLASVGLLAVTAALLLRAVAALFRAQVLLSGQPFSLRRLLSAMARPVD